MAIKSQQSLTQTDKNLIQDLTDEQASHSTSGAGFATMGLIILTYSGSSVSTSDRTISTGLISAPGGQIEL